MKRILLLAMSLFLLASCSSEESREARLAKLKKQRSALDMEIKALEAQTLSTQVKVTPVTVQTLQPHLFESYIELQAAVTGDRNVNATSQAPGTVVSVHVHPGQEVKKGQVLARLDGSAIEQQIRAMEPNITLAKSVYEKQQRLWEQEIGSEVQLLTAKTQYESAVQQKKALEAQLRMYRIESPINGVVDAVDIKVGDISAPGGRGIRVVSFEQLKAIGHLGENYLGEVQAGDRVNLILAEGDTLRGKLSYVARAVDPVSRAFQVEVNLPVNKALSPNRSIKMQIINYQHDEALTVPVHAIRKTAKGQELVLAQADTARVVSIKTGKNNNGQVEILEGVEPGAKVIVEGMADLESGEPVSIQ